MNFLIFLKVELLLFVREVKKFRRETTPPSSGSIPVGSGDERSVNQSIPSFKIAGFNSKL